MKLPMRPKLSPRKNLDDKSFPPRPRKSIIFVIYTNSKILEPKISLTYLILGQVGPNQHLRDEYFQNFSEYGHVMPF